MTRFKKALNISLMVLIALITICIIVDFVCLKYLPTETQAFNDKFMEYLNKPLPVIGVSLVVVGLFLLRLFASSSLGKKQINTLKEKISDNEQKTKELVNTLTEQKDALKCELERLKQENKEYREQIIYVLKLIPNAKVQNAIKELNYGREEKEETND